MKTNVDNPTSPLASEFTTQTNVLASRSLSTPYQNTSGKPMAVSVGALVSPSYDIHAQCDASNTPTLVVAAQANLLGVSQNLSIFFIVLPGYYYEVFSATGTKYLWIEYT